jgi:hypothetical protein
MSSDHRLLSVERFGNAAGIRLKEPQLDEDEVYAFFAEVLRLARDEGLTRVALCLGPETPECLYSVFLAKLISLQRRLEHMGGALKLCECTEQVMEILEVCVLRDRFDVVPDLGTARSQWGA